MTYQEAIDFLYKQLPMYQNEGKTAFKKDLSNIQTLCRFLGSPHLEFKSIHIAGTNGKGSVAHMLASVFQESGYKTGLYTSPHLLDFRERIKIDGKLIGQNDVSTFIEKIKPLLNDIQPSFFEITVALAFSYFAKEKVDVAIIETGLGGRLDSTNILLPELSIITNIGLDHQNMLGNTLVEIAYEKAGIIKKKTPVLIGDYKKSTAPTFKEIAKAKKAKLYFKRDLYSSNNKIDSNGNCTIVKQKNQKKIKVKMPFSAAYQIKNIRTVFAAIDIYNASNKKKINTKKIIRGIEKVYSNTKLYGRWQTISTTPRVIIDGAHNAEGVELILRELKKETYKNLFIIYGCVKDKPFERIIDILPQNAIYCFTEPTVQRKQSAKKIFEYASKNLPTATYIPNVGEAVDQTLNKMGSDDLLIVFGSLFLVADLLRIRHDD